MTITLRPSSAHRWLNCTASAAEEAKLPYTTSVYAERGTFLHKIAASILERKSVDVDLMSCSDKEKEIIRTYVKYVNSIPRVAIDVEYQVPIYALNNSEVYGTIDCLITDGELTHIVDLKTGAGVKVEAKNNYQLMMYAIAHSGLISQNKCEEATRDYMLHIVQPERGTSSWIFTKEQMNEYKDAVLKIASDIHQGSTSFKQGSWCQFCAAKSSCQARSEQLKELVLSEFKQLPSNKITPEFIVKNKKRIVNWLAEQEDIVFNRLMDGEKIPGLELGLSQTKRAFKKGAVKMLHERFGLDALKAGSVTEVLKKVQKDEQQGFLKTWTEHPTGKLIIKINEENNI